MGMYDNVTGKCPYCGKEFYTQTKLFGSMMMSYGIGSQIFENPLAPYASVLLKDVCFECRQPIVMMIENNIITAFEKATVERPMYLEGPWGSFEKNEEGNIITDDNGTPITLDYGGGTASNDEQKKFTNTLPPKEIYEILHQAEEKGIELPKNMLDWWKKETEINENK